MSLLHRARKRSLAAGTVLGLAAGAFATTGTATPASAAPIDFDCTVPIVGAQTFSVDVGTDLPATLPTGSTVTPELTSLLTVPASLAGLMRDALGIDEASGTILSHATVDGADSPTTLTIPRTDIGDSGDAVLTATGPMAPLTGGEPGDVIEVAAGAQDVAMTLFDLAGDPAGSPFAIPCTPAAGQDLVVERVTVVKAGSRTAVAASYNARRDLVTGRATVRSSNGIPATGKVTFVLKKGTKKVASVTKALRSGKAGAQFKRVRRSGAYTLVAQYSGSSRVKAGSGKDGFRVR